jgi:hypothetical protein
MTVCNEPTHTHTHTHGVLIVVEPHFSGHSCLFRVVCCVISCKSYSANIMSRVPQSSVGSGAGAGVGPQPPTFESNSSYAKSPRVRGVQFNNSSSGSNYNNNDEEDFMNQDRDMRRVEMLADLQEKVEALSSILGKVCTCGLQNVMRLGFSEPSFLFAGKSR